MSTRSGDRLRRDIEIRCGYGKCSTLMGVAQWLDEEEILIVMNAESGGREARGRDQAKIVASGGAAGVVLEPWDDPTAEEAAYAVQLNAATPEREGWITPCPRHRLLVSDDGARETLFHQLSIFWDDLAPVVAQFRRQRRRQVMRVVLIAAHDETATDQPRYPSPSSVRAV